MEIRSCLDEPLGPFLDEYLQRRAMLLQLLLPSRNDTHERGSHLTNGTSFTLRSGQIHLSISAESET